MSTLSYLAWTKLKNQLKSLVKKPGRLLYVLLILALLVFTMVSGSRMSAFHDLRSLGELTALALALYAVMFLVGVNAGFSRGGSLFRLSDVNFLFTAPIKPQTVLFYGLMQQMATSLLVGFFLLFQYAWLHSTYGVGVWQLVGLLLGYAAAVFLGQVTAMTIYAFTSGSERLQRRFQTLAVGVTACFLLYLLAAAVPGGQSGILDRAVAAANGPVLWAFPVAGWLSMAANGMLTGQFLQVLLGLTVCGAYLAALLTLVFRKNPDYYEDVLQSAEITQSAISAKKEGTMSEAAPLKVKVGQRGLSHGCGASAFFYKHLVESRRSRKFILGGNSLIFAVAVILYAFFIRAGGVMSVFVMATYLQLFTAMAGRFNLELSKPYLYLVPEPPLLKLLWSLAELLPSALVEAVVIFVPVGLLLGLPAPLVAACILARLSYAFLFTAASIVVQRLWGGVTSRMLVMLLFMAAFLVLALPGIVAGFAVAIALELSISGVFCVLAVVNLPMALLSLFCCRNMLQYAELNNQ